MEYQYTHNNQTYTLDLTPQADGTYQVTIDGRTYQVKPQRQQEGEMLLLVDGQPVKAYAASQKPSGKAPQRHFVHVGGKMYELATAQKGSQRRGAGGAGAGNLVAQMPGQVTQVLVSEGDTVEAGQTLLIMEAMKMEIRVAAPQDGIVKRLTVKQGETVDRGQQLVEIE